MTVARLTAALADRSRVERTLLAEWYAMAGDTTRALELLERAIDHGFYPHRFFAEWCPFMEPLRGMPECDRIMTKPDGHGASREL